jgi:hypothetical protein
VPVHQLSDYGKQVLLPSGSELENMEQSILTEAGIAVAPPGGSDQSLNLGELMTARRTLQKGKQAFEFELPMTWSAEETGNTVTYTSPGEGPRPCAVAVILDTPGVTTEEQVELTEAAMKTELAGLRLMYASCRVGKPDDTASCVLAGLYGSRNDAVVVKTVLRRTSEHTLVVSFFLPGRLYYRYSSLPSGCESSIEVSESDK